MGFLKIINCLWSRQSEDADHTPEISSYPTRRPYTTASGRRRRDPIPDQRGRYYIPLSVLESTNRVMRRFAQEKRECYVWWGGYFKHNGDGQILTALHPEIKTSYGRVHLRTTDLVALHSQLRDLDQILLIELHTHPPGAGGQNEVDAAHPAVPSKGFISIVVPDFAHPKFYDIRNTYVYEYIENNEWKQLSSNEIESRFVIEESFISVFHDDKTD